MCPVDNGKGALVPDWLRAARVSLIILIVQADDGNQVILMQR